MDAVVEEAIRLGKGTTGRDYGSSVHRIIERLNVGDTLLETPEVAKLREQWNTLLKANGLEVVATEGAVVHPELKVAGRFDVKVVDLATGKTHIGDVKTGADADKYLHAHAVQLWLYASAPLMGVGPQGDQDFEITEFADMLGVSQSLGFVFHLPQDGEASVIPVDLTAGRECFHDVIRPTWAWRARKDLRGEMPTKPKRIEPVDDTPRKAPPHDGPEVPVDALRDRYKALDAAAVSWIGNIQTQAQQAGVSFHLAGAYYARRARLLDGLLILAEHEVDDDDAVRAIVRHVTKDEAVEWPSIPVGTAVGSLSAVEAAEFVAACELFVVGSYGLAMSLAGPELVAA
jgi:hypothetical protein